MSFKRNFIYIKGTIMYDGIWFPLKYKDKCLKTYRYINVKKTYYHNYFNKIEIGERSKYAILFGTVFSYAIIIYINDRNDYIIVKSIETGDCKTIKLIDYNTTIIGKNTFFYKGTDHRFRYDPVPRVNYKRFRHIYRHPKTQQEKRSVEASEVKVRAKRNITNLPSSWNDIHKHRYKSWKHCTKKRKQWM